VKKKLLFITPHLSTGGQPQYLLQQIKSFINEFDIYCVEYTYYGDAYVVQRNQVKKLLGDKFFSNTIEFYNYIRYFPNSMKKPNNLFHKYYKHFRRQENLE
jgi:hypothetical protein